MKLKNFWQAANGFVRENLILLICFVGAGFWLLGDDGVYPVPLHERGYDMAVEESAVDFAPRPQMAKMAMGRGGAIPPVYANDFDPDQTERKVIKNANLTVEVEDTEESKQQTELIVKQQEGVITNLNSWEVRPGTLAYRMTLRIPAESLEGTITQLVELGVKKSEGFSTQDITASYFDTENQIKNLEVRRDRLRELMNRKTESLKDVLDIDRELNNVQNQIERLERLQKGRDTDVDYSTLHLNLQPEPEIGDFSTPNWSPKRSWKQSVNDLIHTSQGIFDKLVTLVVFAPIWLPILLLLWWGKRRFLK